MKRLFVQSACALIIISLILLFNSPAGASAAPEVELEVVPGALQLYPGESADLSLVIHNGSQEQLTPLLLTAENLPGVTLDLLPDLTDMRLEAGSSRVLRTRVKLEGAAAPAAPLTFKLTYTLPGSDGEIQSAALASLEITLHVPEQAANLVNLSLEQAPSFLQEGAPEQFHLAVQNKAAFPITLVRASVNTSSFLSVQAASDPNNPIIQPGEIYRLDYTASLSGPSQAGDQDLAFQLDLSWQQNGLTFTGSTVLHQSVPVGALLGMSEFLKLLGLPSFLIVPGLLITVVVTSFWKRAYPKIDMGLDYKSPEGWILAITLSILSYFPLRMLLRHNFLALYSLNDILIVWSASLAAGGLLYGLFAGIYGIYLSTHFSARDNPIQVLQKMGRLKIGLTLNRGKFDGREGAYLALTQAKEAGHFWFVPCIFYRMVDKNDLEWKQELEKILAKRDAAQASEKLKEGRRLRKVEIWWEGGKVPFTSPVEKMKPDGTSSLVIPAD